MDFYLSDLYKKLGKFIMKIGSLIRNFFSSKNGMNNNQFSKEELKKRLTPEQYRVTQENGTERPYKSKS